MVASFVMASSLMKVDGRLIPSGGTLNCAFSEGIFVSLIPVLLAPSLLVSVEGVTGLRPNPSGGITSEDVLSTSEWSPLTTRSEKKDVQYHRQPKLCESSLDFKFISDV